MFFTRAFPLKNKATTIFPDLNQKHYSFASIQLVVGEGIAYGYPDGKFKPKQGVTRAELVT
ncbi:S-layer homology domain-containing protein [Anaerobacillus sp. HL2]|nr:S-layer homology domain-containing protein [Anaerobacillus sp. HL2]